MKKTNSLLFLFVSLFVISSLIFISQERVYSNSNRIDFVVVYPGGPSSGGEGSKIVNQFIGTLASITGLPKSRLKGAYFTRIAQADRYISVHRNAFIMGSLGYYLSHKKRFSLAPLTTVNISGNLPEQYRVIVKKGKYQTLRQLRRKKLTGNVLYEDLRFLNKIVFDNKLGNIKRFFRLKKTKRTLRAVRKVARGRIDAVVLNQMQYQSLKGLSMFKKVAVIYTSPAYPTLGFMYSKNSVTDGVRAKILSAVTRMCFLPQGKGACKNFGIKGFSAVNSEVFNGAVQKYNR